MQLIIATITLCASSAYVLFLDHLTLSSRVLQKVMVIPILILLIILYYASKTSWRIFTNSYDKAISLFAGTIFIQMLVISTGGLTSPFLILIHLFMIAISFVFSFSLSFIFLLVSFLVLFLDISFYQNVWMSIIDDPSTILLQVVSLIAIIPLAYLVSRQYHAKDFLFHLLKTKVVADEAILRSITEMIIVTDPALHIISVNDSGTKMLQRSRSELMDKPLFDVLLLKDSNGRLITAKTFFPDGNTKKLPRQITDTCTIIQSSELQSNITIHVQSMRQLDTASNQLSFILGFPNTSSNTLTVTLEEARAHYEALVQAIKKKLANKQLSEVQTDMLLLEKIEKDTYTVQTLATLIKQNDIARIDIAKLGKQTVMQNQDFATAVGVKMDFVLTNFGMKDIEPLTVKNYPVTPEELTGPFFTVACDVERIELVIKKLCDIAIFLARGSNEAKVTLSVEPQKQKGVKIAIIGSCPPLKEQSLSDLFVPYYGKLRAHTSLTMGSGLEGFLVKKVADSLSLTVETQYDTTSSQIRFTIQIPKKKAV